MNGKFILATDGKTPVEEPDFFAWARWWETAKRHVAEDEVGPIRVSTVFLGLDHNLSFEMFGKGGQRPVLWETMIFGAPGELEGYLERYCSYEDAVRGHARAVELARKALHSA